MFTTELCDLVSRISNRIKKKKKLKETFGERDLEGRRLDV